MRVAFGAATRQKIWRPSGSGAQSVETRKVKEARVHVKRLKAVLDEKYPLNVLHSEMQSPFFTLDFDLLTEAQQRRQLEREQRRRYAANRPSDKCSCPADDRKFAQRPRSESTQAPQKRVSRVVSCSCVASVNNTPDALFSKPRIAGLTAPET